jgi:hypothetical protein
LPTLNLEKSRRLSLGSSRVRVYVELGDSARVYFTTIPAILVSAKAFQDLEVALFVNFPGVFLNRQLCHHCDPESASPDQTTQNELN